MITGDGRSILLIARSNAWIALDAAPWFIGAFVGLVGLAAFSVRLVRRRKAS